MTWTFQDIPDQTGRTAIVTGANAGIGYETARALALKGARVILACRNRQRGTGAVQRIALEQPSGSVELALLDLASLDSVRAFAAEFMASDEPLDLLINNAGVMVPPSSRTEDGFELQIGVNYLGHFALTGLLLDALKRTPGARVVTLISLAHRMCRIDLNSFRGVGRYWAWREYGQSKLACLMFSLDLQHRLDAANLDIQSLAAHPGGTRTELQRHDGFTHLFTRALGMPPDQGALPTLYAATDPGVRGGAYIGPDGLLEARGYPAPAKIARRARSRRGQGELWTAAEQCTDVRYLS